ncbi:MAG: response regulator transcription factor [Planctomycetes bacterium]|nr:response regulator transcription factor [Planctomycetota bacterium]
MAVAPTPRPAGRLLIVDDDVELCELVRTYLKADGLETVAVHQADAGANAALTGGFDLVLLDVGLSGQSGFDVLRRIRAESTIPVLMLTARGEDVDRIVGLELGADDYLPKPFNPRELVARIHAILRRSRPAAAEPGMPDRLVVADVEMNIAARVVKRAGEPVVLTGVEFSLLEVLLRDAGKVVHRDDLFMKVLGRREMPDDRSLDMHVSNLRKKLGHKVGDIERIKTVRGLGYVYAVAN